MLKVVRVPFAADDVALVALVAVFQPPHEATAPQRACSKYVLVFQLTNAQRYLGAVVAAVLFERTKKSLQKCELLPRQNLHGPTRFLHGIPARRPYDFSPGPSAGLTRNRHGIPEIRPYEFWGPASGAHSGFSSSRSFLHRHFFVARNFASHL